MLHHLWGGPFGVCQGGASWRCKVALEDKFTIQTIAQRREILLGQLTGITHDVRELVLETNRFEQVQASYRSRRSDGIIQPAKFRPGQTVFNSSVVIVGVC